jgi:hypothetical protein
LPAAGLRHPLRTREYPLIGCDAYDALADDASPYADYGDGSSGETGSIDRDGQAL